MEYTARVTRDREDGSWIIRVPDLDQPERITVTFDTDLSSLRVERVAR